MTNCPFAKHEKPLFKRNAGHISGNREISKFTHTKRNQDMVILFYGNYNMCCLYNGVYISIYNNIINRMVIFYPFCKWH